MMRPWKDFLIRWVMVFLIGALGVTGCYLYVDIPLNPFAGDILAGAGLGVFVASLVIPLR